MKKTVFITILTCVIFSGSVFSQEHNNLTMTKQELLKHGKINVYYPDFDFDADIKVLSYNVSAMKNGFELLYKVKGTNKFTKEVKKLIAESRRKQRIYFENIKVRLADGSVRILSPVIVKIK